MKRLSDLLQRFRPVTFVVKIVFWALIAFAGTGLLFLLFTPIKRIDPMKAPMQALTPTTDNFEQDFSEILTNEYQDILSREVNMELSNSDISIKYVLVIPADGELAREITRKNVESNIIPAVEQLFGKIAIPTVDEDVPVFDERSFYTTTWTISSKDNTLQLVISAEKPSPQEPYFYIFTPSAIASSVTRDKLAMKFKGFRLSYISPNFPNLAVSSDQLVMEKQNEPLVKVYLDFEPLVAVESTSSVDSPSKSSRQIFLQDLDDWLEASSVSTLLFAILEVLPLLLFLRIVRTNSQQSEDGILPVLAKAFGAFLLFHFSLYIFSTTTDLFYESSFISSVSRFVVEKVGAYYRPLPDQVFELSPYYFGIPVLGIYLPVVLFHWWGNPSIVRNEKYPLGLWLIELITITLAVLVPFVLLDKYLVLRGHRGFFTDISLLLVGGAGIFFLILYLIVVIFLILAIYRDNKNRNKQSWLSWLAHLAVFLSQCIILLPLIVGTVSFLWIYLYEYNENHSITVASTLNNIFSITPMWVWIVFLISTVSSLLYLATRYLQKNYIPRAINQRTALYSVGLLIIIGFLKAYNLDLDAYDLPDGLEWIILLTILGAVLLSAFATIIVGAIERLSPTAIPINLDSKWTWLVSGWFAIPIGALTSNSMMQSLSITSLYGLVYRVDNLILFVWLGGALWFLRECGKADTKIKNLTYEIGILASASILFSVTARWFFVPVTFLTGWLLLRYLIKANQNWEELNRIHMYVRLNRKILLERIINLNAAETGFADIRKKITERFSKGSIKFPFFDRSVVDERVKLDKQTQNAYKESTRGWQIRLPT